MLLRHRLAITFTALPLAFYAYACSDDGSSPGATQPGTDSGVSNDKDSGPVVENDGGEVDAGDAGDAGPTGTCTGNPLADDIDGGTDGGVLLDGGVLRAIATGPFLDGPQWIDDDAGGAIVYSEVNNQVIVRNGPDGGARAILRATGANNLPIGNGRAGDFIYTALARSTPLSGGAVLRMLVDGGDPTAFDAGAANSPNDLVTSSKGYVYFTDPGFQTSNVSTGIYRLAPDGGLTTIQTFAGGLTMRADGIALTKDETTLYVGFFDQKRINRYTVDADGMAGNPEALAFTPIDNPTAIAVDVGGNLWVAENTDGVVSGRIEVIDPTGKKWGEIPFTDSRPTGIAFGGPEGKTVYITTERDAAEGTLWVTTSRCPGVR